MALAPKRQWLQNFLTPRMADYVLTQLEDTQRAKNSDGTTRFPDKGDPHPDATTYPNHRFAHAEAIDSADGQKYLFHYVAERESQDDYNFEFTEANIGGQKFNAVSRTYVTLREDFDPNTPAIGATAPNTPTGLFGDGYVLAERSVQRTGDPIIDSLFVIDQQVYVKRCSQRILRDDDETGSVLYVESNLYYATEIVTGALTAAALFADSANAYWGLSATGLQNEGRQISCAWYEITTTQLVPSDTPTTITGSTATGTPLRKFYSENDYLWPAILRADDSNLTFDKDNDVVFKIIAQKNLPNADKVFIRLQFANPSYRGPTKMYTEEWWVATPLLKTANPPSDGGLPESAVMIPIEIEHTGVNYSVRIEPTLHTDIIMSDVVGTANPSYEAGNYSSTYPATTLYEDWPASLIVGVDQRPFRGGYRITVTTAYRPDHWVAPTPAP